jgi:hypothetical protein
MIIFYFLFFSVVTVNNVNAKEVNNVNAKESKKKDIPAFPKIETQVEDYTKNHYIINKFEEPSNYEQGGVYDVFVPYEYKDEFTATFKSHTDSQLTAKAKNTISSSTIYSADTKHYKTTRTRILAF